ncbi:ankyrin repeat-containing protein [Stemphylium lycopersici]|nr:ankyrin repeat-containing protein [Stemphylium lycopersici]RAR03379.1 ankyrin repeat-containing protein [Stemphylium lycopersici]
MARFLSIPEVTPDWIATNGAAVIYRVISMGQTIMFRCLLESTKLDPNAPIDQYQCIIRLAAAKGQGELIRLLLESNTIDLDLFRNRSLKILRTAAARGHYKVVEILLQFPDTTVAEYDKYGGGPSNALHLACINGHPEVVKLLLQAFDERKLPVDIEAIDLKCLTPLEVAVNYGALEVVKLLLSRPDIDFNERKNCPNSWGNIPIWRKGVKSGRAGILTLLLDNVRTDSGQVHDCRESLLGLAASLLHWSVVNVLLNYTDSSPLSSTQQGGTLPQESPTEAFDVMRRLFHDKRFLQYSKDAMGRNLWNIAARTGNTDLASTLLKFVQEQQASEHPAIDVNRYENYGHTPLHTAVRNNRIDIVKLMLQHKDLDINLRTRDHSKPGKSALDIAIHNRGLKALQKLSSKEKCSSIIEILLAHGAQSYQNRDGHHFPTPHQGYVQEPAPHANATWASIAGIERNEMAKEDLSKEAEEVMDDTDSMEEDALLIDDDAMFDDWMNFDDGDT